MNYAKRATLYLLRKKGKTISLFILIFVVATFLISCFSILNASENLSKDIRTSLGAAFYLRARTGISTNENGESTVTENLTHITTGDIDAILQLGNISYCNPINYGYAKGDSIQFIPGEKHTEDSNMGRITALNYSALAPGFTEETVSLADGRHITKEDTGAVMISSALAAANHLAVGGKLNLTHAKLAEENGAYIDEIKAKTAFVDATIVGIYEVNVENTALTPTAGMPENEIYASLDVLTGLKESEKGIFTGEVDFYITDPAKLATLVTEVQEIPSIDWDNHFIRTNDFQYSKIADSLSSLGSLIKILLVCVSVVSAAILTLILTMRIRGRMQEAGVLLAAGVPKREVLGQFLLEVMYVALTAFICSYLAANGLTSVLGHSLFADLQPNLINADTLQTGINAAAQINTYLAIGIGKTVFIYLCELAVVIASVAVSSAAIIRMKPKEILTKMS